MRRVSRSISLGFAFLLAILCVVWCVRAVRPPAGPSHGAATRSVATDGSKRGIVGCPPAGNMGSAFATQSVGDSWLDTEQANFLVPKDDPALADWLAGFSTRFISTKGADQKALDRLRTGGGDRRFNAVLLVVLALHPQANAEAVVAELKSLAMSPDDLLAGISLRALVLRMSAGVPQPPSEKWLRILWTDAFADEDIGELLDPGFGDRLPELPSGALVTGRWTEHAESMPRAWDEARENLRDTDTIAFLRQIALHGLSGAARTIAIITMPGGPDTDEVVDAIVKDPSSAPTLREMAYRQLSGRSQSWLVMERALQSEKDPGALASICGELPAVIDPNDWPQAVQQLEKLAPIAADSMPLATRLTIALSLSDTDEGIDALVRLVRHGPSDLVQRAAAAALGVFDTDASATQRKIQALLRLSEESDPVIAAYGGISLMRGASSGASALVVETSVTPGVMDRLRAMSSDPHVPKELRDSLVAQLAAFAARPGTPSVGK